MIQRFSESIVVVVPEGATAVESKAAEVLIEEIHRRTGLRMERKRSWPAAGRSSIALGTEESLRGLSGASSRLAALSRLPAPGPEGYRLLIRDGAPGGAPAAALVAGADPRGVLYGVGRLLRSMELRRGSRQPSIQVPALRVASAPRMRLRGAQLGYRPKTNAYDAWTPEQFDQYIRELALFGANAIEILPPRTDDEPSSPHFRVEPLEMMQRLSAIIDSYGLDVWVWYPNMAGDYAAAGTRAAEEAERDEVFRRLPRLDHVMIPGGDPGALEPEALFDWSARVAEILSRSHPQARVWISPQVFNPGPQWMERFHAQVAREPQWLAGLVYGPWVPCALEELRARTPARIPIRNYPDITHSLSCQFPVEGWDLAFALTLGRECCNPRPVAEKHIHNLQAPYVIGSLAYSEGINDDTNKLVWLDQDWDPDRPVLETLRDIGRLFVGPDLAEGVAQGLLGLERNWRGPLASNDGVEGTLARWRAMEKKAGAAALSSYRFKMNLQRALYDAYVRRRLLHETGIELEALEALQEAASESAEIEAALDRAEELLRSCDSAGPSRHLRDRCWRLADELFREIGWQTSVARHQAIGWARGAFMDGIDVPLNNRRYLLAGLRRVRGLPPEARPAAVRAIAERASPGPGGFYHDLGTPGGWEVVVRGADEGWASDPGGLRAPFVDFEQAGIHLFHVDPEGVRGLRQVPLSWISCVSVSYITPLRIRYPAVEPGAAYHLRVVYFRCGRTSSVRLVAGDRVIHEALRIGDATADAGYDPVHEYDIPAEATLDGTLDLEWQPQEGTRTFGVSEVWLLRA